MSRLLPVIEGLGIAVTLVCVAGMLAYDLPPTWSAVAAVGFASLFLGRRLIP